MSATSKTVGIYEYAMAVDRSPKHIYEQIRMKRIPATKVGKKGIWRIPLSALEAALAGKPEGKKS